KNQKKENAQDIISKSIQKVCTKNLGRIDKTYASKFGFIIGYTMGSKSKLEIMKSYRINKKQAEQKLKNKKRESALDIISKSILNAVRKVRAGLLIHSKFFQL
ncbi:hypothetical protein, partial [Maribacter sp. 2308TA10-17]|uniref:hypothetical protein n=1 Tax=Maribacter sp. 2308TA10-17 TaxID=3386276 RepID=UPI0039BC73A8